MFLKRLAITMSAAIAIGFASAAFAGDITPGQYASYPVYSADDLELTVNATGTHFRLWSPAASAAKVNIYASDNDRKPEMTLAMRRDGENGTWIADFPRQLYGKFYTFQITQDGKQLNETPGIWAKATGVNGKRAAIIDFSTTNPEGWENDKGPEVKNFTDVIIYEMHHRDMSASPTSGVVNNGKFLALTEHGTKSPQGLATSIDHLKELGVTHVHILPSFDYNSVDEARPDSAQYNWGYDPLNYNVPEGSYSTNPGDPAVRVREMKAMVKALHDAGIGVIMDVVYNHTATTGDSAFDLTSPGYFYRHRPDGTYSDASACGNETSSELPETSDYIVNSMKYWTDEYHIDGFRVDLMAIHDTETMSRAAREIKKINPSAFIYGEGWTASDSPLPVERRALKENVSKMEDVAVFSDDIRDAVKGSFSSEEDNGFASGKPGKEEALKAGIVAATAHPQVDFSKAQYSRFPYATSPEMIVNYVSCHDDLCLTDKLDKSMPGSDEAARKRAAKLAQTIVFTSQGTPFMFAGEEIFRDKKGVHNSYKSPDSVNAIDWNLKARNIDQFEYYRGLIALRKAHPAFRLSTAEEIARHLVFDDIDNTAQPGVVSYSLIDNAGGDSWKEIKVIFNGSPEPRTVNVPEGEWNIVARDGKISPFNFLGTTKGGELTIEPTSALILARN